MLPVRNSQEFPLAMKTVREKLGISRLRLSVLAGYCKNHTSRFEEPTFTNFRIPSHKTWLAINNVLETEMKRLKEEQIINTDTNKAIACNDNSMTQTIWQPIQPYAAKPVVKQIEYFTVEGIRSEVKNHIRFKDFNWKDTDWRVRVCVKFPKLEDARRLYGSLQAAGLVAVRDWVE